MKKTKLTGADALLLLLFLDNQKPIDGAIRLTKMMFLFEYEIAPILKNNGVELDNLPEFFAYNYGPFSKDIYEQLELFSNINFIRIKNLKAKEELVEVDDWQEQPFENETIESDKDDELNEDGKYYQYVLENLGTSFVKEKILPNVSDNIIKFLTDFKRKIVSLSPKAILKYVYTNYPDYTKNSVIKDEVLGSE